MYIYYGVANTMFVWPLRFTHLRTKGAGGRTKAVDQPLLQAYRLAGGTSYSPLVCLCYTRAAMHGRRFRSARVIVALLRMPSVLNVFPSAEPSTIAKVCIQFAGFEPKSRFEEIYCFVAYPSNCHIITILCDVGGGSTGVVREPRHRPLPLVFLSHSQNPGFLPHSRLAGALTHVVSATETPYCGRLSTTPNSEVASILRCLAPYRGLAWLPSSYLPSLY